MIPTRTITDSSRPGRWPRRYAWALAAVVGVLVSLLLFHLALEAERQRRLSHFHSDAENRISALRRSIANGNDFIEAVGAFFEASEEVTREEFHRFSARLLHKSDHLQAFAWIPRLPRDGPAKRGQGADGAPPDAFAIRFIEPTAGYEAAIGFDLGGDPAVRAALKRSGEKGTMIALEDAFAMPADSGRSAFHILRPVLGPDRQTAAAGLRGFVAGSFEVATLFDRALGYLEPQGIDLYLFDVTAGSKKLLHYHPSRSRSLPAAPAKALVRGDANGPQRTATLQVADRRWEILCVPAAPSLAAGRGALPWTVLVAGLLLTALSAAYTRQAIDRGEKSRRYAAELLAGKESLEREVASRRAVEKDLAANEETMRQLTENIHDVFWVGSADWQEVLYISPAYETIWGRSRASLHREPLSWLDAVLPEDRDAMVELFENADFESTPALNFPEYRIRRPDGEIRWILARAFPVRNESGRIYRVAGVAEDITERKTMEIELQRYQEHLEKMVEERTVGLEGTRRQAEEASRAKSRFLAVMSHELRTPLSAILGFAEILRHEAGERLPARHRDYLQSIGQSGRHLLTLIEDILDISRIEEGRIVLQPEDTDLDRLFDEALALFRGQAKEEGLELVSDIDAPLGVAVVDVRRCKQILFNLLANAAKFTPQGGTVSIRARRLDEGEMLQVTVADTGIGIPAADRRRIFDFFYQADASSTRQFGGVGLGLAIVRELVERMGGTIELEERPGQKGTSFRLKLPLDQAGPVAAPTGTSAPPSAVPQRFASPWRILLVEDNPVNREVALAMLENLGCDVETVENGRQAVDRVRKRSCDLVLMDCQMPGMDGFAATRLIRRRERKEGDCAPVPIVALTAHAFAEDRQHCLESGMNDFLAKPFTREQLFGVLKRWLPEAGPPEQPKLRI